MNSAAFTKLLDGRITSKAPYGRHIGLTCVDHPELSWSTKNIGSASETGTGIYMARHIFFDNWTWVDGKPTHSHKAECDCPASKLIVNPKLMEQPDVPA